MTKVAIHGLGRVGRLALRRLLLEPGVEVVGLSDLASTEQVAPLLRHDSLHGRFELPVEAGPHELRVGDRAIPYFPGGDPEQLPFGTLGATLVLDCSGQAASRAQAARHLRGGVTHVLHPGILADADATILTGLDDGALDLGGHPVLATGGAATQALAHLASALDDAFGLELGFATEVHSFTPDQRILDLPHSDLRLARAAALSMIPTATGAPAAVGAALPRFAGRLDGLAVRVPTPDVSLLDLTATLARPATLEAVQAAFHLAADRTGPQGLRVLPEELVSSDLRGETAACLYDPFLTKCLAPRLVKVFGWFDNEVATVAQLVALCRRASGGR